MREALARNNMHPSKHHHNEPLVSFPAWQPRHIPATGVLAGEGLLEKWGHLACCRDR